VSALDTTPGDESLNSAPLDPGDESLNSTPLDPGRDPGLAALEAELKRAFAFFNARYWDACLPPPVFAFFAQPPNGRRLGHFLADAWEAPDGSRHDEVVFYADLALESGMQAVVETLLHELVHVWQHHFGVPGRIHNAQWHAEAQRVGLVTRGPTGLTWSGDGFLADYAELAPCLDRIPFRRREGRARKPGKLAKWVCLCGFGVRVAVPHFDATCNLCGQRFRRASPVSTLLDPPDDP
jgi:hypothetical protein